MWTQFYLIKYYAVETLWISTRFKVKYEYNLYKVLKNVYDIFQSNIIYVAEREREYLHTFKVGISA